MSKQVSKKATNLEADKSTIEPPPEIATSPELHDKAPLGSGYQSPKTHSDDPDVSALELKLMENNKLAGFMLLPSDITKIWRSTRVKDELVKFLQEIYKPKSQFEQEKVEYNQINILAEYIQYNMIFAKNELMFDTYKTAVIVQLFWNLLEFNPDGEEALTRNGSKEKLARAPEKINLPSGPSDNLLKPSQNSLPKTEENDVKFTEADGNDADFQKCLVQKINLLKRLCTRLVKNEKNPSMQITLADCHKILAYAKETYFKHLRLYEFVFNNQTASELKRITFKQEEAKACAPLESALMISNGRPQEKQSRLGDRSRHSKDVSAMGNDSMMGGEEDIPVIGDMEQDDDEEEMGEDDQVMEDDQDVKPDASVHDTSVHGEVNQENFDKDIEGATIALDEKLTLQKGFSSWEGKFNSILEKKNSELEDKTPAAKKK